MKNNPNKSIIIWLLTGCILIFLMVVIGGITRLTHSGLSMAEWNPIIGSFPPITESDWIVPFEKYKLTPEYKILNNHFTIEEFKSIYWWEYTHRFLGRFIGVIFIIPFLYFLIRKKFNSNLLKKIIILFILGAFQGFLGWFMVKSGLQKNPAVSHFRLAAHLISALTVYGFTFWYALILLFEKKIIIPIVLPKYFVWVTYFLFSLIIIQIIYGAFVAGLKAGLFYNTFPLMGNTFFPETILSHETLFSNITENPAGIQFIHRLLATIILLITFFVWYSAKKLTDKHLLNKLLNIFAIVIVFQFLLGVITLIYKVPVVLGVLHQCMAFFLFTIFLVLLFVLKKSKKRS